VTLTVEGELALAGTKAGGRKAAITMKTKYGANVYETIGRKGGQKSVNGGFRARPDIASEAGKIGGKVSSRRGIKNN
jgi:general stress protein YciG